MLFMSILSVFGQDTAYTFKVLASKGVVQGNDGNGWVLLKSGSKILLDSKIKLSSGSYVGLMHSSGKTLELKTDGTYVSSNLEEKLQGSKSSFSSKYASFVLNNMEKQDSKSNSNVTGSVSRGLGDVKLILPGKFKVLHSKPFEISWTGEKSKLYKVEVLNLFDETFWMAEAFGTETVVDINFMLLSYFSDYIIRVTEKGNPKNSSQSTFSLISMEKEGPISIEMDQIESTMDVTSPLEFLKFAYFFDQNGLPIYAMSCLKRAEKISPDHGEITLMRQRYVTEYTSDFK